MASRAAKGSFRNIGVASENDRFARYTMPELQAKVEGRGNGIKTNVVNNVEVAKALDRPPEYLLKHYGYELGALTTFDKATGTSIVNGAHDRAKLAELLQAFIKQYVCCYSCGNPETRIGIKKENVYLKCRACGRVSDVDPRHKLATFILRNPPEHKLSKEEQRLKEADEKRIRDAQALAGADKKEKKKDKRAKEKKCNVEEGNAKRLSWRSLHLRAAMLQSADEGGGGSDGGGDGVVWMTDTSAAAARRRAQEQLTAASAAMVELGDTGADDKTPRQAAKPQKAVKGGAAARPAAGDTQAAPSPPGPETSLDPVAKLVGMLRNGVDADTVARELVAMAGIPGGLAGKVRALYEAALLAEQAARVDEALKSHERIFARLAQDRAGQLAQLVAFEHLFSVTAPERVKEAPRVLKALYDLDIVEGEVVLAWARKADAGRVLGVPAAGGQAVRRAVSPVVQWLQQEEKDAEESDEEVEDGDDGDEV